MPSSRDVLTLRHLDAIFTPIMNAVKRSTVYFDPDLHRALRLKAAETDRSLSELVNEAVRLTLAEDAEDLAAFEERAAEPSISFDEAIKALKRSGKI
jgi:hypothetical protein